MKHIIKSMVLALLLFVGVLNASAQLQQFNTNPQPGDYVQPVQFEFMATNTPGVPNWYDDQLDSYPYPYNMYGTYCSLRCQVLGTIDYTGYKVAVLIVKNVGAPEYIIRWPAISYSTGPGFPNSYWLFKTN